MRSSLVPAGMGGYAEQVAVSVAGLSVVPEGLTLRDAAALPHDGPTALALAEGWIDAGDRVLVVGASGGLGIVSAQLASARGARVVAVARDACKLARISERFAGRVRKTLLIP